MSRAVVAALVVVSMSSTAYAETPLAYVDEIVAVGGPDVNLGREFAEGLLRRAGFRARFAAPGTVPCREDTTCLVERAHGVHAVIAVRLTIADVGGSIAIAMMATRSDLTTRREVVQNADLSTPNERLAATLRELLPEPRRRRRVAAWSLVAASAALVIGGGASLWYARDLRSRFFADHVAASGDVFGISPAEARAEEGRARRWSQLGGILLGGAVITGTAATVLFVRGPNGESRPAGISLAMELP